MLSEGWSAWTATLQALRTSPSHGFGTGSSGNEIAQNILTFPKTCATLLVAECVDRQLAFGRARSSRDLAPVPLPSWQDEAKARASKGSHDRRPGRHDAPLSAARRDRISTRASPRGCGRRRFGVALFEN
jgi:hypothetical protein